MAQEFYTTNVQVGDALDLPAPVRELAEQLRGEVSSLATQAQEELRLSTFRDELFLMASLGYATAVELVVKDLRSLLTAYAHAVATERPSLQEVASWQRVTPGNLRRRYTAAHVKAVQAMLDVRIPFDVVQLGFTSVRDGHIEGLNAQSARDYLLRTQIRARLRGIIEETASVLHGKDWQETTLVESAFDPNPFRGYAQVSASTANDRTPLTQHSPRAIELTLEQLDAEHAEYFEFERSAVEAAEAA
ncbi:MAG: hypothetical protein ACTH43_01030 [Brachybacterium sp.]|uniref:hypothetical protein n=1 Tax=Brachybacterium sp. TaxID=1891286 RepID=UPI003F8E84E5